MPITKIEPTTVPTIIPIFLSKYYINFLNNNFLKKLQFSFFTLLFVAIDVVEVVVVVVVVIFPVVANDLVFFMV